MKVEIKVEVPEGKSAEWVNGVLTLVDKKDNRPVTERIKTLQDAIDALGSEHALVKEYNDIVNVNTDLQAYLELRIIVAALNEGWEPQFNGEYRWFPWFKLIRESDIEDMDDEEKSRVVLRSGYDANAYGGCVCVFASYDASFAYVYFGARLSLKSEELALYAGRQFAQFYAEFIFGVPCKKLQD